MEQQAQNQLTVINRNIPQNFLRTLPPVLQVALRTSGSVQSVDEVVALTDEPKIAKLKKTGGDAPTYNSIRLLLVSMSVNLHIDNGLTEANINNIARRLTTDSEITWWLTLADIDLLCRKIVNGEYGKFYNHFSEGEFYDCMTKYCNTSTEIHHQQAESNTPKLDPAVLAEANIGYHIGEDGRLVVHDKEPEKKRPPRYLYDNKGNVIGENPAYWASYGVKNEKSAEDMQRINESNKFQECIFKIMDRDGIGYVDALFKAKQEFNPQNQ